MREAGVETDSPIIDLSEAVGKINSDLTVGVDLSQVHALHQNAGLSSRGMSLHGSGFIVTRQEAEYLGLGRRPGLEKHIREYRNGRDLAARPRGVMVIDLFGLDDDEVRRKFPEVYQHLMTTVKPEREKNNRESYRANWWIFGEPRRELRPALTGLRRYIATVETMKHRIFQMLGASILPDNKLVAIASDDPFVLGVLCSRIHVVWSLRAGGWLGVGNDPVYVKSSCFDPFPFPVPNDLQKHRIRAAAEDLDQHRKRVLAEKPRLTLTGLYNALEKVRAGIAPNALDEADRRAFDEGQVLIMWELHDKIDAAVADAYGWPAVFGDDEILVRLVALNQQRAKEETRGLVRWLRPEYQIPKFGTTKDKAELDLVGGEMAVVGVVAVGQKPAFPTDEIAQTAAVMTTLMAATSPVDATMLSTTFRQGRKIAPKVTSVLAALARMGFVMTGDGGRTFTLRRAA